MSAALLEAVALGGFVLGAVLVLGIVLLSGHGAGPRRRSRQRRR